MKSREQQDVFNSRIKRIQRPRKEYTVDPNTGMKIPRRVTRDQIGKKYRPPIGLITKAALWGAFFLLLVRYLRMEVFNIAPYFPNALLTEVAMASMAAIVLGGLWKMRSLTAMTWQAAGALICAVTMHNAVWAAPDTFATVFSQGYVDEIIAATDPRTIFVNGTSYPLPI